MKPLVTVVVPSYNYGHFLSQTLASIRAQSYPDWECIVVDDGSTDDTWDLVLTLACEDDRIKYVRRPNGGLAAARNTGIQAGSGDYLQFLDADDLIEPSKLEIQVGYLEKHRHVGIVYGGVRFFDTKNPYERRHAMFGEDRPWMPEVSGSGDSVLRTLIRANIMVVNSPLARRDAVDRIGNFNETLESLEDWDYWIRCAAAGVHFQYLDAEGTLALVRIHQRSMSQNRLRMHQQQVRIRKAIHPDMTGEEIYFQNRWHLSEELGRLGLELIGQGDRLRGVRYAVEGDRARPYGERYKWVKKALSAIWPLSLNGKA